MKAFIVGISLVAVLAAPCFGSNCPRRRQCVKKVKQVVQVIQQPVYAAPYVAPQVYGYQVGEQVRLQAIVDQAVAAGLAAGRAQGLADARAEFRAALQGRICVEFGSDGSATVHPAPNGPSGPPNGDLPPPPDGNGGPPPPPGDEPGPPNGDSAAIWQKAQAVANSTCVRCHTPGAAKYAEHELDLRDLRTVPCERLGLAVHRAWVGTMPPGLPEGQGIPEPDAQALFDLLKVMGSARGDGAAIRYQQPQRIVSLPGRGTPTTPDVWAQMRGLPLSGGREPDWVYDSDTGRFSKNVGGQLVQVTEAEARAAGMSAPPNP